MPEALLGTATLAPRPALVLAIDRLRGADRGDHLALGSLRAHLRALSFVDVRCAALTAQVDGVTVLRAGVEDALVAYRGSADAHADAWLNREAQRAARHR
jgi:hypothetical protein